MKKNLLLLTLSLAVTLPLHAADGDGTATAIFLRMEQGARAMGMGGAYVAMSKDIESVWWNPAGAAFMEGPQVNAAYSVLLEDIVNSYAAFALPVGGEEKQNTLMASINYMNMGTVETRDVTGLPLSEVNPYGLVASIGYAFVPRPNVSLGFIVKSISQNLGNEKGSGIAVDGGLQVRLLPDLSAGLAVQNLGPKLKIDEYENKLPLNLRAGVAYTIPEKVIFALDAEKPVDADISFHLGSEIMLSEIVSLRGGYNTDKAVGFSAGIGLLTTLSFDGWSEDREHNMVRIDYAYVSTGNLDPTHRLSLTFKL